MTTYPYRIIGIDPGYGRLGIAILERDTHGTDLLLHSECFETSQHLSHPERLATLSERIAHTIEQYEPAALAIERLFFSKNKKTALAVAESRGAITAEAAGRGLPVYEYTPAQIKIAITGYGGSDKRQIITMIKKLLGINKKALDDEYDAIAVGITHLVTHRR